MRGVLGAVTAICAVLVLPASAAEEKIRDGRIAFRAYVHSEDSYELFSVRPDGSDRINLSRHFGADAGFPTYSPDGRWIAFGCAELGDERRPIPTDVCVVEDGVKRPKPVRLTDFRGYDLPATFTPDSKRILFTAGRKQSSIYMVRRDGTDLTRLTDPEVTPDASGPVFSPDGKQILFNSFGDDSLYLMDRDGSDLTNVTDHAVFESAFWPSISPDGTQLLFLARPIGEKDRELFVSDLQGGNIVRLTNNALDNETYPTFSPDGELIAYIVGAHRVIWTVRPDGTDNEVSVSTGAYNLETLAWAPSGARLVFEMKHQGSDIGIAAPGDFAKRITRVRGIHEESPAWAAKP